MWRHGFQRVQNSLRTPSKSPPSEEEVVVRAQPTRVSNPADPSHWLRPGLRSVGNNVCETACRAAGHGPRVCTIDRRGGCRQAVSIAVPLAQPRERPRPAQLHTGGWRSSAYISVPRSCGHRNGEREAGRWKAAFSVERASPTIAGLHFEPVIDSSHVARTCTRVDHDPSR
jgi:hypothetical protein